MEEKDVQRLLDMLYGMIDEAKSVAFSSDKCIIVRDEALDLLDEIRAKLPLELKKAQELIAARSEYVAGAKKEAQEVLRQAELDAKVIVSESETIQLARQKSNEIVRRADYVIAPRAFIKLGGRKHILKPRIRANGAPNGWIKLAGKEFISICFHKGFSAA